LRWISSAFHLSGVISRAVNGQVDELEPGSEQKNKTKSNQKKSEKRNAILSSYFLTRYKKKFSEEFDRNSVTGWGSSDTSPRSRTEKKEETR